MWLRSCCGKSVETPVYLQAICAERANRCHLALCISQMPRAFKRLADGEQSDLLRAEWATDLNLQQNPKLSFETAPACGTKSVWWRCSKQRQSGCTHPHVWEAVIGNRNKGSGCPWCSGSRHCPCTSLAGAQPDLVPLWHDARNGCKADQCPPYSKTKVQVKCIIPLPFQADLQTL